MKTYRPEAYWQNRGKNYTGTEPVEEVDYMKELIAGVLNKDSKVLEVGSGYGRIYKSIKGLYDITLCDFVDSMRKKCQAQVGVLPDKWDGKTLPYSDKQFDMLILFDVMMHVTPDKIADFLLEMKRVSKHIYIATYYNGIPNQVNHVIEHKYYDIFNEADLEIKNEVAVDREGKGYVAKRKHWLLETK